MNELSISSASLSPELAAKHTRLKEALAELGHVAVAFSGGVDSTLLLAVGLDELGTDHVLAVMATSESGPAREKAAAVPLLDSLGASYRLVATQELADPRYLSNPPDRCFICKTEVFSTLAEVAREAGFTQLVDGSNLDDIGDHRPGTEAARRAGVRSPLQEAGLTKADIRALSRQLGLPTWNKPSAACLSSRVPYNTPITVQVLRQIDAAEQRLIDLGFEQVRVRHHGAIARIEIRPDDIGRLAQPEVRNHVVAALKELGYQYVTLDLEGYRTGSLNEQLAT